MKKAILHRSIFAVVACIALAACVLLTSVKVTPVVMAEDVKAMVGAEAETAFCTFHEDLQVWYQEMPVSNEGVKVSAENGYDELLEIFYGLEPYVNACATVTDEEDAALLKDRAAHIQLRRLIAGVAAKQILHRCLGQTAFQGDHFGGNFADALKPLHIEGVFAVMQSGLGQRLQFHRPVQPGLVCVHKMYLSQENTRGVR